MHTNKDKKDENNPGAQQDQNIALNSKELEALKCEAQKAKDYYDKLLRLQADFDNARKRMERQSQEFANYASSGIILELLNVLDDLERAVEAAENKKQDFETFLKGIEMILAHLYEMLKEHGLKPIEAKGKKFDPNYHEALMQVDCKDHDSGLVIEELQKGYFLKDKVLRTAKVKVSSNEKNDNVCEKPIEEEKKDHNKEVENG